MPNERESTRLLGLMAANRKQFFELLAAVERGTQSAFDVTELTGLIDSEFAGRENMNDEEASIVLMLASVSSKIPGVPRRN
jgi:hypothetical protein